MIYVLGHKNPDTDSTCSPIVVAWYLNNVRKVAAKAVLHGHTNKESAFVLKYWNIKEPEVINNLPEEAKVFLVDSTNPDELPLITEDIEVTEIVDHHKMGGLTTSKPLNVTIRTYGCTATLLYEYMLNETPYLKLPKEIAGLMLSAILSDTLNLKGPSTTDKDREIVKQLKPIAGIEDINEYADKMFDAKSSIEGMSMEDIVNTDAKEYELGGKRSLVAVFETVKPQVVIEKKEELVKALETTKTKDGYQMIFFFVIDILNEIAYYFSSGEQSSSVETADDKEDSIIAKGYNVSIDPSGITMLDGVVSRKKQIVPVLEKNA